MAAINTPSNPCYITYYPSSHTHLVPIITTVDVAQLRGHFEKWITLLKGYEKEESVFEDFILNEYAKAFYEKMKSDDPADDQKPLTISQQIQFDRYLQTFIKRLDNYQGEIPAETINEIKEEAINLQKEQGGFTINQVKKKFSKLLAKAQKASIAFTKEAFNEFKKVAFKEVATFLIEQGKDWF